MLTRLRQHLTYANVMATIAVFMVLGGGAYAATALPADSVGTKQIKNKAVTLEKIGPSARKALKGPKGDTGPSGPRGASGGSGPAGVSGYEVIRQRADAISSGMRYAAQCPAGKRLLGGGVDTSDPYSSVNASVPDYLADPPRWIAVVNTNQSDTTVWVYAICANLTP